MQTEGTLSKWNARKGCGYITPQRGGQDIYVDSAAFPDDGPSPQLREKLLFTVTTDPDGKKRAVQVQRPRPRQNAVKHLAKPRPRVNVAALLASAGLLAAILFYGYTAFYQQDTEQRPAIPAATREAVPPEVR